MNKSRAYRQRRGSVADGISVCTCARVAELADAPDLGSGTERREGSSPSSCTKADPDA